MHIIDDKIYHSGEEIGWIDGHHVKNKEGVKLGYVQDNFVFHEDTHKVAYIHENQLVFENGNPSIPVQSINEEIVGTVPIIMKCAIHIFFED